MGLAQQAIDGYTAIQKEPEFQQAIDFLSNPGRPFKSVLEVGTERGGTLWVWCQLASDEANLVSVDMNNGIVIGAGALHERKPLARARQNLIYIEGNSHDQEVLDRVRGLFPTGVDFLFIDGDHSPMGVEMDWDMYHPLVNKGGAVMFHDICRNPVGAGVDVLWDKLKATGDYSMFEFKSEPQTWGGIGIVQL
jgi:predicted O-methyltransferase YrrM